MKPLHYSSWGGNVFTWTHHGLPSQWYSSTDHRMQQGVDGFAWGTQYTKYESTTYILPQLFCTQVSKMRYWTWQQLFWFILTLAFLKLVILLAIILRYMIVGLVGWKTAYRVPASASIYFLKERWLHQLLKILKDVGWLVYMALTEIDWKKWVLGWPFFFKNKTFAPSKRT